MNYAIKIKGFKDDGYYRELDNSIARFRSEIAVDQQIHLFGTTGYANPDDCKQVPYPEEIT